MTPFFKNAQVYSLRRKDVFDTQYIEAQLAADSFKPCSAQCRSSSGWVPVIGSALALIQENHILVNFHHEEKLLPSTVIKDEVAKRIKKIEAEQGRRLRKTERDSIKDEALHALLPRAFSRFKSTLVWIDLDNNRVVVNASSPRQAENILALLRRSLGSLPVVPFTLESPMSLTVKEWILEQSLPKPFNVSDMVRLCGVIEGSGKVAYTKSEILTDEVSTNIESGKIVSAIGLDWSERISFKVDDGLSISSIKFSHILTEQNDDISREEPEMRFDADFLLFRSEFNLMFEGLVAVLGGEVKYD